MRRRNEEGVRAYGAHLIRKPGKAFTQISLSTGAKAVSHCSCQHLRGSRALGLELCGFSRKLGAFAKTWR